GRDQTSVAAAPSCVPDAGSDDWLGVFPRRHAADRDVVSPDDVRVTNGDGADAVYARVVPDAGGLVGAAARCRGIGPDYSGVVDLAHDAPDPVACGRLRCRGHRVADGD